MYVCAFGVPQTAVPRLMRWESMLVDQVCFALLVLSVVAVAYHHLGYPLLLRRRAAHRRAEPELRAVEAVQRETVPSVVVIVPAHNEAAVIADKIANLASLNYPADRVSFVIALDGCTDETKAIAEAAIARAGRDRGFALIDTPINRGKIAVLNDQIAAATADIVALSDASALINADALTTAAQHFSNARVGVVCGTYELAKPGSEGERKYWQMQTQMKADEAALAAPMGAHGALYFFRRALWQPLPADTINDDFVLPMQIVAAGHRAVYDRSIVATELELTATDQEFRRRVRIGAGNMQQLVRLKRLADPRLGELAFLFLSGKGLRPVIPFLILLALLATALLALNGATIFQVLLAGELALLGLAMVAILSRSQRLPRLVTWLGYLVEGHAASALGVLSFLYGGTGGPWKPSGLSAPRVVDDLSAVEFIPDSVQLGKRVFDIVFAALGLLLLSVLLIPIALAIKLDSKGPVLFRQTRVGRSTPEATYLFQLIKFRSMRVDAEAQSGPAFACPNDPRVTGIGGFLRRTRLDELPQLYNVLVGDMSVIGPRPERPWFVRQLDQDYPFYTERTCGLRPGITGLAQVNQDYEASVRDVNTKIGYDHAYVLRLSNAWSWLTTDVGILIKTVYVVFARTGQ